MVKVIDPAKLSGTLKILAENAAIIRDDKNLVDNDLEVAIFKNNAMQYLEDGVATDYTKDDLNEILGIKKAETQKHEPSKSEEIKGNPYKEEFSNLSAQELADKMFDQISGFSRNQKTLDMYDAIPDNKLGETVARYNKKSELNEWKNFLGGETSNPDIHNYYYNHYDSMFYAMNDEWGMEIDDIKPRIERLVNIVSSWNLNDRQKSALNYVKLLLNNAKGDKFDKQTICLIENNLAVAMNGSMKYKKEGIFGTNFFQRWTMEYSSVEEVNESLGY